jgi:multiple sugar transport system permease protein
VQSGISQTALATKQQRSGLTAKHQEMLFGILFAAPVVLHLVIFKYYPVLYSIGLSLYRGSLLNPFQTFFGSGNYLFVLRNEYAIRGFLNTFLYAFMYVPGTVVLGIILGLLVSKERAGKSLFRVAYYTPVVVSIVAAVQVWSWVLSPNSYGLANIALTSLGLPALQWFYHPNTALASVAVLGFWNVGLNMLIFLAAIKNIPAQLYESATVDGAGPWRMFWRITIPLLMPTIYFVIITATILSMRLFEPILLLTGGGPLNATTTVSFQIYEQAFQFARWGRASAQATIFFFIVLVITVIQYKVLPESYEK